MAQERNDRRDDMPANERIVGPSSAEDATTEEEKFAREAGIVETSEEGATTTGDEREIGRAGEGGLEGATGRDSTLGRRDVPLTGKASELDLDPRRKAC